MPSYNVMGVARRTLEASVRYRDADLGPQLSGLNAISAGPMRTLWRGDRTARATSTAFRARPRRCVATSS
jgi:enoyl-[acyl-carrier-protein] reductase (NADH)